MQPKLTVNQPGDRYEQEADRIADRVVSTGSTAPVGMTSPGLQRMTEEEDELQTKPAGLQRMEEEEDELQLKSTGGSPTNTAVTQAAAAISSGGAPLSTTERGYFEPRLGHDLSRVRLHDNARAGAAARGINARAYTLKNHIAFAPGTRDFTSTEGRRLMAHELVHTVQQGGGRIRKMQRKATAGGTAKGSSAKGGQNTNKAASKTLKPTCDVDTQAALSLAKNRAVAALGRTLEAMSRRKSRLKSKRRDSRDRKLDRVLKNNLGVRRGEANNFDKALATLQAAEAFLAKQDLSKNHIICDNGLPNSPCGSAQNAAGYHRDGRIYVCTKSSSIQTFIQFGINKAETEKQRVTRIEEQLTEESDEKDRAEGREPGSTSAVPDQPPNQQGTQSGATSATGPSGPNSAIGGGQQSGSTANGTNTINDAFADTAPNRFRREAAGMQGEVGQNEILVAQTRLASFLIHESMHDAIKGKEIDVYMHDDFFEHLGRKRPSAPPDSAFALINPDSYVMFVLDMEESGNTFDSEADEQSKLERDLGKYGFHQLQLRTPRNTEQLKHLTVRPVLDSAKIKNAYNFASAVMHETFTSLGRAGEEFGGPANNWTDSTQEIISILQSSFGLAKASTLSGNARSTQSQAIADAAKALNEVYIETFHGGDDSQMVIYRRRKSKKSAKFFVKVPLHSAYKNLSLPAQVRLILEGANIDTRVDATYQSTAPNPIAGRAVDLVVAFSRKNGILSL